MPAPKCLVFPDGADWLVFAPRSRLVLRTNAAAAERFRELRDEDPNPQDLRTETAADVDRSPTRVTISCSNQCANRCVYCYGTPIHRNRSQINPDFCHAALDFVATNARRQREAVDVYFHGVGEPTLIWPLFTRCVAICREAGERHCVATHLRLCTGGQVSAQQADWLAENLDEVTVSLDGPADIQNRQRPRSDGRDALTAPLRLALAVRAAGKRLAINTTITRLGVRRMVEIVEFVAQEIGPIQLRFGMMFAPPWVRGGMIGPPDGEEFVRGFEQALRRGHELGIVVEHPSISMNTLVGPMNGNMSSHFCLAPHNVVTLFYDVPREREADPQLGVYGWYVEGTKTIRFDWQKLARLRQTEIAVACQDCPCFYACSGPGGVKGRMPRNTPVLGPHCQTRIGVLKVLLRQGVPRRQTSQEVPK